MPSRPASALALRLESIAGRLRDPRRLRFEREVAGQSALVQARAQLLAFYVNGLTMRGGTFFPDKGAVEDLAKGARLLADEADQLLALLEGVQ